MEGGGENGEKFRFPLRMNGNSRDLMNGLVSQNHSLREDEVKLEENDEEIELSLGLSMNGRFGVDPARKKLRRYSSTSNSAVPVEAGVHGGGRHARGVAVEPYAPLGRTCSLPSEPDEWRHRKVLQSTMSMEARKKRMEKLKNGRLVKDKESCLDSCNGSLEAVNGNESGLIIKNVPIKVVENGHANAPSEEGSIGSHMIGKVPLDAVENGLEQLPSQGSIGSHMIRIEPLDVVEKGHTKLPSQGSIGSQGSGSSGLSDVQSQETEGTKQTAEVKSSSSNRSVQDQGSQEAAATTASYSFKNAMLEMPFVSTKENGPNGNKVDGFLYGYKKGEDVRIVCVCHGNFFSPAEFVKHGGGGDVEHPLKHIVVNPSPLF